MGVRDGVLALTTMLFADEVRATKDVDAATQKSHKPTSKQLNAAVAVIEQLSCEWEPEKYKDRYRARLKPIVQRQAQGPNCQGRGLGQATVARADLMAALEHDASRDERRTRGQRQVQVSTTGGKMTHPEEDKESEPQTPPEEPDSEQPREEELSPEAKEIEEDPSLNPDDEILRDIRGG